MRTAPLPIADPKAIPLYRAAEILNKSEHSVRQLMTRGVLNRKKIGYNVYLDVDEVLRYHARKKGLPSWEVNYHKFKDYKFIVLEGAAQALMVQPAYVIRLIKEKKIEGYVTAAGEVMISRDSINKYLRTPDVGSDDL